MTVSKQQAEEISKSDLYAPYKRCTSLFPCPYKEEVESLREDLKWVLDMTTFGQRQNEKVTASEFHEKCELIKKKHGMDAR